MSWEPTQEDIEKVASWGLDENPFKALDEYSDVKAELRWLNPHFRESHMRYYETRKEYIQGKNFYNYYKTAYKPFEKHRWEYLMQRKAWYITPMGWSHFCNPDCRKILDLGCGDGDVIGLVMRFIDKTWKQNNYAGHDIEIFGLDLNQSRIDNAKLHLEPINPHFKITLLAADAFDKVPYENEYFDYTLCTGVLEIIDNDKIDHFISELTRVTKRGMYIEDVVDRYPGGEPRDDLPERFLQHGFKCQDNKICFQEPFTLSGTEDPIPIWGLFRTRNMFLLKS